MATEPIEGTENCRCGHPRWDHWKWGTGKCTHCDCPRASPAIPTPAAVVEAAKSGRTFYHSDQRCDFYNYTSKPHTKDCKGKCPSCLEMDAMACRCEDAAGPKEDLEQC